MSAVRQYVEALRSMIDPEPVWDVEAFAGAALCFVVGGILLLTGIITAGDLLGIPLVWR